MPDPINPVVDDMDPQAAIEKLLADPKFQQSIDAFIEQRLRQRECEPERERDTYSPNTQKTLAQTLAQEDDIIAVSDPSASILCESPLVLPAPGTINVTFLGYVGPGSVSPIGYEATNDGLWLYPFVANGLEGHAFCLNRGWDPPIGNFGNVTAAQAMPSVGPVEHRAVAFIIANMPNPLGTDTAGNDAFWTMLGVRCPGNDRGWDAYAIGRYAIWTVLGQIQRGDFDFINSRASGIPIPNNQCLLEAYTALVNLALDYGSGNFDCGEDGGATGGSGGTAGGSLSTCCSSSNRNPCEDANGLRLGCQLGEVFCCNTSQSTSADTFVAFDGCPNDIRENCGRVLLGPFRLATSGSTGAPTITMVPCDGCPAVDILITDYCGCILSRPPSVGQEFYIAFRPPCCKFCFQLCAEIDTTSIAVFFFRYGGSAQLQNMAASIRQRVRRRACINVCIDITPEKPPPPPPEPELPWWEKILINNNNNNNNDSSSNNNNSSLQSLLETTLLTSMLNSNASNLLGLNSSNTAIAPGVTPPWPPWPPFPPGPWPPPWPPCPPGPWPPGPPPGRPPCRPPCKPKCCFPFPWHLFPCCEPCPPPCPPKCPPKPCPPPCPPKCLCPRPCCCCPQPCPPPCCPPCNGPPPCPPPPCFFPPPCPPLPCPPMPCLPPGPPPGCCPPSCCELMFQPPQMPCYQAMPMPVSCCPPMPCLPPPCPPEPCPMPVPVPVPMPVPVAEPVAYAVPEPYSMPGPSAQLPQAYDWPQSFGYPAYFASQQQPMQAQQSIEPQPMNDISPPDLPLLPETSSAATPDFRFSI